MATNEGIHILIVEDNPDDVKLVTEMLRDPTSVYKITHADQLSSIEQQKYDLVLLDLNLSDSSGLDTVLKVQVILPDIPIVVMTGVDNEELSLASIQAGAQDYLVKGQTDSKRLRSTIQYALQRHRTLTKINELGETHKNYFSTHDVVTGLCNQQLFLEHLQLTVNKYHATQKQFILILLKVHELDKIIATYGHHVKDNVLKTIAQNLVEALSMDQTIVIARYSEDIFAVVLNYVPDKTKITDGITIIQHALSKPILINIKEYVPYFNIGAAVFPFDGDKVDVLIKNTQSALTTAIKRGTPEGEFFGKEMSYIQKKDPQVIWHSDLQFALHREEFFIEYQPQIDVITNKLCGVEALLRWKHPKMGLISPGEFVPIAEENHLIAAIESWALETVSQHYENWKGLVQHPLSIRMCVNISVQQIQYYSLVESVRRVLAKNQIPHGCLELELTETIFMDQPEPVIAKLNQLKKLGIRIAIDDFGHGYSSLSYLSHLPVDAIKIDMKFVQKNLEDAATQIIVQSIIELAHSLKLIVTAVGVETDKQFELLKQQSCDVVQGYYFSKPVSPRGISEIILNEMKLPN